MLVKTQVVLYIFNELIEGRKIYMEEIVHEYEISIRTFRRYIGEINIYLSNFNKFKQIKYNNKENCYQLEKY